MPTNLHHSTGEDSHPKPIESKEITCWREGLATTPANACYPETSRGMQRHELLEATCAPLPLKAGANRFPSYPHTPDIFHPGISPTLRSGSRSDWWSSAVLWLHSLVHQSWTRCARRTILLQDRRSPSPLGSQS